MTIKWFPRSWIQIKSSEYVIYIDPSYLSTYFKSYPNKIVFSEAEDDALPEDLEKGNLILISHIHKDHCKEVTINRLSTANTIILTPKKYTKEINERIKVVKPRSKYYIENILIEVIDAYNTDDGTSTKKVHKKGECLGFIINIENKRLYFAGDTDYITEMEDIGDVDIAILPIGGTFTMNIDEAIKAAGSINPKCVMPIHHLKADPIEYKMKLEEKTCINVKVLKIGEEFIV